MKLLPSLIGFTESYFPGRMIDLLVLNDADELIALEAI
jgi:hypothetical protein